MLGGALITGGTRVYPGLAGDPVAFDCDGTRTWLLVMVVVTLPGSLSGQSPEVIRLLSVSCPRGVPSLLRWSFRGVPFSSLVSFPPRRGPRSSFTCTFCIKLFPPSLGVLGVWGPSSVGLSCRGVSLFPEDVRSLGVVSLFKGFPF